jgi:hypothetical protein
LSLQYDGATSTSPPFYIRDIKSQVYLCLRKISNLSLFLPILVVHSVFRVKIIVEKLLFHITFFNLITVPQITQLLFVFFFFLSLSLFFDGPQELFS